jgi:hypothetical protein
MSDMGHVEACILDLHSRANQVGRFKKEVLVTSIDDFVAKLSAGGSKPAIGIMYEGARPIASAGGSQINVSAEFVFSVMVALETPTVHLNADRTPLAHSLLDDVRYRIHGGLSPTGHKWKWVVEAPVAVKGVLGIWLQRWSVVGQLPPGRCN